ncbi:MAG: DNA replication/repair protein RecF [Rhodobacterales bacterium]|nr:DNA replication/repair protein RecF [Rhodobacterales bacterium]MDX5499213.1 DNA replication/repair protein RecF [Rhodobacterales bacterium]
MLSMLRLALFRSHKALRLEFDGRPVAIWGPNGAGKTNILEAISLLSPGRGLRRAVAEEIGRRPDAVGWKVAAVVDGHEVETWAEGAGRQVKIDGKAATQAAMGALARVVWLVPAMDRLWIEAPEGRRRFLDRLVLSLHSGHAEAALDYERAMRERNRLLKDQVQDVGWYGAIEARMVEAGTRITEARRDVVARLQAAQVDGAFPAAMLELDPGEGADDLAAALVAGRRRDMAAGRSLSGPHRADLRAVWAAKSMPAAQCSTGEQKALLISLILASARIAAEELGRPPLILLDEVAAHLDPGRRAALYDEICALGAQAFLTGTEAGLFETLGARAQGFAVAETGGVSEVIAA